MKNFLRLSLFLLLGMLVGCTALKSQSLKGPGWYKVKQTDSLYSIAWRYGLDFQQLAKWNGLREPYHIKPGQQLTLLEPDKIPSNASYPVKKPAKSLKKTAVIVKPLTPSYNRAVRWQWPTDGKLLNRFSMAKLDQRGIDIAGKIGQPVRAVADGKVVYSGTGLSGYGNLIIVKHDNIYLSAYAYNSKRLVKEGKQVKAGEHIADMGTGKNKIPMLHFQIRKKGKPVDPLKYLPTK
jgi:lipoprotein NlpD